MNLSMVESPEDTVGEFSVGAYRRLPAARVKAVVHDGSRSDRGLIGVPAIFANSIPGGV
jgi:hypothetical protein